MLTSNEEVMGDTISMIFKEPLKLALSFTSNLVANTSEYLS